MLIADFEAGYEGRRSLSAGSHLGVPMVFDLDDPELRCYASLAKTLD